jgi:hypothetical protein
MKHVRLPIYDEGLETMEHLEVSVEILERLAATSIIYKDHVKVVQSPTPEQEKEMIDRIISGLPPRNDIWDFMLAKDSTVTQNVQLCDVSSKYPEFTADDLEFNQIADGWRPIPGFSKYEMSKYQMIAHASTGTSVAIIKGGRVDNVLLENDEGVVKRMSVKHLFEKTFPEY